jgi:NAD(P)-dependent dehydrogenase (short-subunit alcohol dehydrogenase family)
MFDLSGKTVVVTGAGRGLGAAMAIGLSSAGANIVCAARTSREIADTADAIMTNGGNAIALEMDACNRDSCSEVVSRTIDHFGTLDVISVNHGIGESVPAEDITKEQWARMIDINLTGCFNIAQAAGRAMIKQGSGGSIILTSSNASTVGFHGLTSYGASKGGVDQLCRQLAVEWGRHNIRVNTINPGYMSHGMRGSDDRYYTDEIEKAVETMTPLKRRGEPEELVGPAVFLASDASSFITGHVLTVDGGYSIF